VEARIRKEWNKFSKLVPLITNKDVSLLLRETHGSETWPAKKENEWTLQQAEMRMIMCICGIKVADRFACSELRDRLYCHTSATFYTNPQHNTRAKNQLMCCVHTFVLSTTKQHFTKLTTQHNS